MNERKYKIKQVSGSSARITPFGGDTRASMTLIASGFKSIIPEDQENTYIGAIPQNKIEFFVYYQEPLDKKEESRGTFRLVSKEVNGEKVIDEGTATSSHIHGGLDTLTFYGEGRRLRSWSFHCEKEEIR